MNVCIQMNIITTKRPLQHAKEDPILIHGDITLVINSVHHGLFAQQQGKNDLTSYFSARLRKEKSTNIALILR